MKIGHFHSRKRALFPPVQKVGGGGGGTCPQCPPVPRPRFCPPVPRYKNISTHNQNSKTNVVHNKASNNLFLYNKLSNLLPSTTRNVISFHNRPLLRSKVFNFEPWLFLYQFSIRNVIVSICCSCTLELFAVIIHLLYS